MPTLEVAVRALDNLNLMGMVRGYQPGDPLRCVHEWAYTATADPARGGIRGALEHVAELTWMLLNTDDRPTGKFAKSMSIGDVIELHYGDGVLWLAADVVGFKEVENPGPVPFDDSVGPYLKDHSE